MHVAGGACAHQLQAAHDNGEGRGRDQPHQHIDGLVLAERAARGEPVGVPAVENGGRVCAWKICANKNWVSELGISKQTAIRQRVW